MTLFYLTDLSSAKAMLDSYDKTICCPIIANPPYSINYMGLAYIHEIIHELKQQDCNFTFLCDVGDNAAYAIEAVNMGFKHIIFNGSNALLIKLQQMSQKYSAKIYSDVSTACKICLSNNLVM